MNTPSTPSKKLGLRHLVALALTLTCCTPIGLFLLWKWGKLSFLSAVLIGFIWAGLVLSLANTSQDQSRLDESHYVTEYAPDVEPVGAPQSGSDVENRLKRLLSGRGYEGVRVEEIQATKIFDSSSYNVVIKYRSWGAQRLDDADMIKTLKRLFQSYDVDVHQVWLAARAEMIDRYGNEKDDTVYEVTMTKDVARRINWANAEQLDFSGLWTVDDKHPAYPTGY